MAAKQHSSQPNSRPNYVQALPPCCTLPLSRMLTKGRRILSFRTAMMELARATGIETLDFDADGSLQIIAGNFVVIAFDAPEDRELIEMSATVAPVPEEDREAVFAEALTANLACREVGGAYLSLDTATEELVLCQAIRAEGLTAAMLEAGIESFLVYLQAWRDRMAEGGFGAGEGEADPANMPSNPHLRV
ncbi:MAG: type III secretion system chaperone [Pseudomonadota bacterium]